jgi:hypothetical protein
MLDSFIDGPNGYSNGIAVVVQSRHRERARSVLVAVSVHSPRVHAALSPESLVLLGGNRIVTTAYVVKILHQPMEALAYDGPPRAALEYQRRNMVHIFLALDSHARKMWAERFRRHRLIQGPCPSGR